MKRFAFAFLIFLAIAIPAAFAGKSAQTLDEYLPNAASVFRTSDGTRVWTRGYDGSVKLWDAKTGRQLPTGEEAEKAAKERAVKPLKTPLAKHPLLREALALDRELDPKADTAATTALLEKIENAVRQSLPADASPEKAIEQLNREIFTRSSFQMQTSADNQPVASLGYVLREKKGNCVGLSILYAILGERLGLSISPVRAPGHIFLKCHLPEDAWLTVETTLKGENVPDDLYKKSVASAGWRAAGRTLLKPLPMNALLSEAASNLGSHARTLGDSDKAIRFFQKAVAYDAENIEASSNIGFVHLENKRYDEALGVFQDLTMKHPGYPVAWNNHGVVLLTTNHPREALADFMKAIAIDSRYADAWANAGAAHIALKNNASATQCLEKARACDPTNPRAGAITDLITNAIPRNTPKENQKKCRDALVMAENLLKNNQPDEARSYLRIAIETAPESDDAIKAKKLLASLTSTGK